MDIGAALTRKIGPLPAWAWGGVVGVGALAVRSLGGGGATARNSGAQTTIGGDGASWDYGDLPSGSSGGSGGGGVSDPIGGALPAIVGQVSSAFTLQQQLNDALQKLSNLLTARNRAQDQVETAKRLYRDGMISVAERDKRIAAETEKLSKLNADIAATNTLIADLKKRLTALFAAPAAAA